MRFTKVTISPDIPNSIIVIQIQCAKKSFQLSKARTFKFYLTFRFFKLRLVSSIMILL